MPGLKTCAVLCVLRHAEEFLLLLRAREPNRGLYTPVGGKLRPFESPRAAVIREVREETGFELDQVRFCGTMVETSPVDYNWWCAIYQAEVPRVPPPPCAEGTLEWVTRAGLGDLAMPVSDRFVYDYVIRDEAFAFAAEYDAGLYLTGLVEELRNKVLV